MTAVLVRKTLTIWSIAVLSGMMTSCSSPIREAERAAAAAQEENVAADKRGHRPQLVRRPDPEKLPRFEVPITHRSAVDLSVPEDKEFSKAEENQVTLDEIRLLAERGHVVAQVILGDIYGKAEGIPQNDTEAVKWFRRAAEQGFAMGQDLLGAMYAAGRGVPQDSTEAVKWFHKAAEQGEARSQGRLCASYGFGSGVPQDYVQAYAWCNLAAARGEEPRDLFVEARDKLATWMTPEEHALAQKVSREYWEAYVVPFRD